MEEYEKKLIEFYKEFLLGSAKAVEILSTIQKSSPEGYEILKEIKDNPNKIYEITTGISDEVKDTLIIIIAKASSLGKRMNNIFELSADEQEKLSNDIKNFSNEIEKRLTEGVGNA